MLTPRKDINESCHLCSNQFEVTEQDNGRKVKILVTPCNHMFHRVCLRNWFRNETNGNFCPHCKRSMEWRDATPFGRDTTSSNHSSRTNSQSEPEVQSLEAEIRHRKAQELLQRKQEAERAKFELSEEQRAKNEEKRRRRREARNAVQQKSQISKTCFILLVWVGSVACVSYFLFANEPVQISLEIHYSTVEDSDPLREQFYEVRKRWKQKLDAINRQIQRLEQEIAHANHHEAIQDELQVECDKLHKKKATTELVVTWFSSEMTEKNLDFFPEEMAEFIYLADRAVDFQAELDRFVRKNNKFFGQLEQYGTCTLSMKKSSQGVTSNDLLSLTMANIRKQPNS